MMIIVTCRMKNLQRRSIVEAGIWIIIPDNKRPSLIEKTTRNFKKWGERGEKMA
jgi:hypothetical protein